MHITHDLNLGKWGSTRALVYSERVCTERVGHRTIVIDIGDMDKDEDVDKLRPAN
jgi:hypothetical protein